jgi:hypothetical protein
MMMFRQDNVPQSALARRIAQRGLREFGRALRAQLFTTYLDSSY